MTRSRKSSVSWPVLLGMLLPTMVAAVLVAFCPTGWVTVLIVGVYAAYMLAIPIWLIMFIARRSRREGRRSNKRRQVIVIQAPDQDEAERLGTARRASGVIGSTTLRHAAAKTVGGRLS